MIGEELAAFDGRFLGIDLPWTVGKSLWVGPGERDLTEADQAAISGDGQELLRRTSVAHELRHFHDFLLAPLGSLVVRSRFLAAVNTLRIIPFLPLRDGSAATLPVPIGRWLAMAPDEREEYLGRATALFERAGRPLAPVFDLPFVPTPQMQGERRGATLTEHTGKRDEVVAEVIAAVARQLSRVDYALGGIKTEAGAMYPSFPFEASGVLAQLHHIGTCFGVKAMSAADKTLASKQGYAEVLAGVISVGRPTEEGWQADFPTASTLYVYALLGSCEPSGRYCEPLLRQGVILQHILRNGTPEPMDTRDLFEEWDELLDEAGLLPMPTFEGLEASLQRDAEIKAFVPKLLDAVPNPELIEPLIVTFGEFVEARRKLVEGFLEDPQRYLHLGPYFKGLAGRPRPPVRVTVPDGLADACIAILARLGWSPLLRSGDHQVIGYPPAEFLPGEDAFQIDALDVSTEAQAFTDMLFTDTPRAGRLGVATMKSIFGEDARVLRIIGSGNPLPESLAEAHELYSRT